MVRALPCHGRSCGFEPRLPRFILIIFLLCGCSPHSSQEFHQEGETRCQALTQVLAAIETPEQLRRAESDIKKKFEALVVLMIEARRFQEEHPEDCQEEGVLPPHRTSLLLKGELERLYQMEGGRELIERAQQESLVKLDAYERSLRQNREKLPVH